MLHIIIRRWFSLRPSAADRTGRPAYEPLTYTARPARSAIRTTLASATRDYARAVDAGHVDRLDERELRRLASAMGPHIWAWQRARRLTSQTPWRANPNVDPAGERLRAALQMTRDLETWEEALRELDAEVDRARIYDKPAPEPLILPAAVAAAIAARRAANLARATRRQTRSGDSSGPTPALGAVEPHPPPAKSP